MRIFTEYKEGCQTTVGLSKTAIFSVFAGYFSDTLEMRQVLLYSDTHCVVHCCSVIPKCMTLNDLEWLLRVKIFFRAGLAGSHRATFEK